MITQSIRWCLRWYARQRVQAVVNELQGERSTLFRGTRTKQRLGQTRFSLLSLQGCSGREAGKIRSCCTRRATALAIGRLGQKRAARGRNDRVDHELLDPRAREPARPGPSSKLRTAVHGQSGSRRILCPFWFPKGRNLEEVAYVED